jgi:hypothetical protein
VCSFRVPVPASCYLLPAEVCVAVSVKAWYLTVFLATSWQETDLCFPAYIHCICCKSETSFLVHMNRLRLKWRMWLVAGSAQEGGASCVECPFGNPGTYLKT